MTTLRRAADHHEVMTQLGKPKPAPKVKKAKNPPIDKEFILQKRQERGTKFLLCDCGCFKQGHDLHHAFIGRMKGYPILDDERNLVLVNHDEHIARKFDTRYWRIFFWETQVQEYGEKAMYNWIEKVRAAGLEHRLDFLP